MYNIPGELLKGRYISTLEVGAIIGMSGDVDEDAFRLATLKLKRQIEKAAPVIARGVDGGIQILTDVQGSDYVHKRFKGGIRRLHRLRESMQTRVEVSNLSGPEIAEHSARLGMVNIVVGAVDLALEPKVQKPAQQAVP